MDANRTVARIGTAPVHTTADADHTVTLNVWDTVQVTASHTGGGAAGTYEYIGPLLGLNVVNLATEDFSNTSRWRSVLDDTPTYTTDVRLADINPGDIIEFCDNRTSGGVAGTWYKYIGTAVLPKIDLTTEDFTNTSRWEVFNPRHVHAGGTIDVLSKVTSSPVISAQSAAQNNSDTKGEQNTSVISGSLAVSVGVYSNDADAYINQNARIDAAKAITVKAAALNDYVWQWGMNLIAPILENATYTTKTFGPVTVKEGETVEFCDNRTSGGDVGTWYKFIGSDENNANETIPDFDPLIYDFTSDENSALWEAVNPVSYKANNFVTNLSNYLTGDYGVGYYIANDVSQATAEGEKLSLAGAVTIMTLANRSDASIRSGALDQPGNRDTD